MGIDNRVYSHYDEYMKRQADNGLEHSIADDTHSSRRHLSGSVSGWAFCGPVYMVSVGGDMETAPSAATYPPHHCIVGKGARVDRLNQFASSCNGPT